MSASRLMARIILRITVIEFLSISSTGSTRVDWILLITSSAVTVRQVCHYEVDSHRLASYADRVFRGGVSARYDTTKTEVTGSSHCKIPQWWLAGATFTTVLPGLYTLRKIWTRPMNHLGKIFGRSNCCRGKQWKNAISSSASYRS